MKHFLKCPSSERHLWNCSGLYVLRNELELHGLRVRATFSTTKVGSYFNLKSQCSTLFTANVVYRFTCSCDKSISYVGETRRQLFRRIEEHCDITQKSAVLDHLGGCDACQDHNISESFEILQRCGRGNILSTEAMMICKLRPSLNTQLGPFKGAAVSLALYKWGLEWMDVWKLFVCVAFVFFLLLIPFLSFSFFGFASLHFSNHLLLSSCGNNYLSNFPSISIL